MSIEEAIGRLKVIDGDEPQPLSGPITIGGKLHLTREQWEACQGDEKKGSPLPRRAAASVASGTSHVEAPKPGRKDVPRVVPTEVLPVVPPATRSRHETAPATTVASLAIGDKAVDDGSTPMYILNRSPTKALNGRTLYEAWHGRKPAISHLRVFGCLAFGKELGHIGKLDDRSTPGVFIGYAEGSKAYRILDPGTQRVRMMCDVVFDEGRGWTWDKAVDDGSTPMYDNFTVEYVHFEGAGGVPLELPPEGPDTALFLFFSSAASQAFMVPSWSIAALASSLYDRFSERIRRSCN
jgi:hypothetical protein